MTLFESTDASKHLLVELLGRYRAIVGAAWAARRELAGPGAWPTKPPSCPRP